MLAELFYVAAGSAFQTALFLAVFCFVYQLVFKGHWKVILNPRNCTFFFAINVALAVFLSPLALFAHPLVSIARFAGMALTLFIAAPAVYKRF